MSTPLTLRRLYSLDTSSPDFLRHVYSLFRHDKEEGYLSTLQGSELTRLIDFLDETLSAISANREIFRRCLYELQAICGHRATLPSSCVVSDEIARVDSSLIAPGPIADAWEGTYRSKKVSIKTLKAPLNDDQTLKELFFEEAVMWKRLRHPNIVPFIGVTTNPLQIVSEWMPNGTLMEFVERNPGMNRIGLLLDVAEGLDYLHANDTLHGNLKGSTILVDRDGHARLTDFEFTSIVRGVSLAMQEQGYTAAWATPEILKGADKIMREADVFAFGTVVMEVFTGKSSSGDSTVQVTTSKIMNGEQPVRPQEVQGLGLTDSVWDMTVSCWRQDPTQRPTMTEVVQLLRECYRMATWRTRITDIPIKLLVDNILPFCGSKDVLSLRRTNRFFAPIATDETVKEDLKRSLSDSNPVASPAPGPSGACGSRSIVKPHICSRQMFAYDSMVL